LDARDFGLAFPLWEGPVADKDIVDKAMYALNHFVSYNGPYIRLIVNSGK